MTKINGPYIELCFAEHMGPAIMDEKQRYTTQSGDIATLRVYVTEANKRAVVVKEDDILTKLEIQKHAHEVSLALKEELGIWIMNSCFKQILLKDAENVMTSRFVCKWKFINDEKGNQKRIIRMRLVLRGFMDTEAFPLDTFFGYCQKNKPTIISIRSRMQKGLDYCIFRR